MADNHRAPHVPLEDVSLNEVVEDMVIHVDSHEVADQIAQGGGGDLGPTDLVDGTTDGTTTSAVATMADNHRDSHEVAATGRTLHGFGGTRQGKWSRQRSHGLRRGRVGECGSVQTPDRLEAQQAAQRAPSSTTGDRSPTVPFAPTGAFRHLLYKDV